MSAMHVCKHCVRLFFFFFFSSRRRHTRFDCDWSSDVCSSDLKEKDGTEIDFHRTYGDWHRALTDAGFVVTDILEPEPLPRENTYADVFPLSKIQMIPGTTIWRARKPAPQDASPGGHGSR